MTTSLTKPTARELDESRRRRFWAKHSTPAQLAEMAASTPMAKVHAKFRTRIVYHCHHRCFVCSRFIANEGAGACPGVKQSNPRSTPACHEGPQMRGATNG